MALRRFWSASEFFGSPGRRKFDCTRATQLFKIFAGSDLPRENPIGAGGDRENHFYSRTYSLLGLFGVTLWAVPTVPDNGSGTAALPIRLPYVNEVATPFMILNGLPPGTTIRLDAVFTPPTSSTEVPGGGLGGTTAAGNNMNMNVTMTGSGTLAGFNRTAVIPVSIWQQDNALRVQFRTCAKLQHRSDFDAGTVVSGRSGL